MNKGILWGLSAYIFWGILPLYWKALDQFPAAELLSHRIVWSMLVLVLLLLYQRQWAPIWQTVRDRKKLLLIIIASLLLALNWLVYLWAVNANMLVEASLGYFINPLVNVALGVLFLREKLRLGQWVAIGVALSGVLYLTINYGALPWIGLTVAFSFGLYGLLKKITALNAVDSLSLENSLLFLPALCYLIYAGSPVEQIDQRSFLLLPLSGLFTAFPLILFGAGAHRIPLSLMGILQYITPTLQFLLGVLLYGELMTSTRLIGFILVWSALAIYSIEGVFVRRQADEKNSIRQV